MPLIKNKLCIDNCGDGSDETIELCGTNCSELEVDGFACANEICIRASEKCNGHPNCKDGSDETIEVCGANCTNVTGGGFACGTSGHCILKELRCDGRDDCKDKSDETTEVCKAKCKENGMFACSNGTCIRREQKCDGVPDCSDANDETAEECKANDTTITTTSRTTTTTTATTTSGTTTTEAPTTMVYRIVELEGAASTSEYFNVTHNLTECVIAKAQEIWKNTFNCIGNYSTCRLNPASYVPDLECAKNKCKEFFKKQENLDDTKSRYRAQSNDKNVTTDFTGIDLDKKIEVSFFSHSEWEDISDCDALIHVPTKDVPCEAL